MAVRVPGNNPTQPADYDYGGERTNPSPRHQGRGNDTSKQHSGNTGWRDSNDYRADYFKRNKGIGGFCYVCSQCFKPMFSKSKIQVDHIIPPSKFAIKRRRKGQVTSNSIVARFLNNSFNCAAICPDCNRRKSNKMDGRIFKGYTMKMVEMSFQLVQIVLAAPFIVSVYGIHLVHKLFNLRRK